MSIQIESSLQKTIKYDTKEHKKFNRKYSISDNIEFFRKALLCISAIHEYGARKYSPYSFEIMPDKSDNLIHQSVNAIKRHVTLFRTGNTIDNETLISHLGHIATRGGSMLLTQYYRTIRKVQNFERPYTRPEVDTILTLSGDKDVAPRIMIDLITPEVWISILKYNPECVGKDTQTCLDLIEEVLFRLASDRHIGTDIYNDVMYPDLIFWNVAKLINETPEIEKQCVTYLNKIYK